MKKTIICFLAFLCICNTPLYADEGEFDMDRWYAILNQVQDRAIAENISPYIINQVIQNGAFIPSIIQKDKNQAEFKLILNEYLTRAVSNERITMGRTARAKYPTLLRRTEQKFGVSPHVILAFWGMESRYGQYKASHKLSDAFLTLIYDGRREKFFGDQLLALMKIAEKNNLKVKTIRGSWAGAMGHFQFIPTTLQQYGVDGNGDDRIDIINNISDAMFSAGNYLNKLGWNKDEKILRTVATPENFDKSLCDGKTKKTLNEWAAMGIKNPDESAIPRIDMVAGIICEANSTDEKNAVPSNLRAYLTYPNFYRIKKWNNSNWYAIAIGLLAEELKK
ncbi:MAG: lytic murein transglycosylase [Rickettsiales bacterium]|jgi:membrane-bound lytic murein transglycosylase B|nr:lytic murein transglycosylase [Rickettsiales bacterium]